jgi:hypothetical protein
VADFLVAEGTPQADLEPGLASDASSYAVDAETYSCATSEIMVW